MLTLVVSLVTSLSTMPASAQQPTTVAPETAGMVVFGVAVSRVNQLENDPGYLAYRSGHPADVDVCEAANRGEVVGGAPEPGRIRDICSEGGTWEVSLGIGHRCV
ncbi:MAG TPA: hypothetical protein ENK57_25060 [Polyangiaceae bacterium]|nr:hypothetical protein [Polyangiaceae bacterium]